MSAPEDLLIDRAGGRMTITINRPRRLNALRTRTVLELCEAIEEAAPDYAEEYGLWGVFYSVCSYLEDSLPAGGGTRASGDPSASSSSAQAAPGERGAAGMPDWYPKDPKNFPPYHDETAPRVVDVADLFSDAAEERMEARLRRFFHRRTL